MPRWNRVSWLPLVTGLAVAASAQSPGLAFEVASNRGVNATWWRSSLSPRFRTRCASSSG